METISKTKVYNTLEKVGFANLSKPNKHSGFISLEAYNGFTVIIAISDINIIVSLARHKPEFKMEAQAALEQVTAALASRWGKFTYQPNGDTHEKIGLYFIDYKGNK